MVQKSTRRAVRMADDPIRSEARVLSDHLDALGCSIVADEFQSARSHDDLDWVKLKCLELLKAATQSGTALDDLLRLLEVDWDAWERREEARRDAAKAAGAQMGLRVDEAAFERGSLQTGEICEIEGVGPVSLATARELLGDSIAKLLVTSATDVHAI